MANTNPQDVQAQYESSGRQGIRVFLEGKEVPCSAVSMSAGLGSPKTASIQLVPLSIIKFIHPRTQVHVFVRDSRTFGNDQYYLCFEGEVIGRSMSKQHDGRAVTITAMDYSSYLDDAKAFIMNPTFLASKATTEVLNGEPMPEAQAKAFGGKVINTYASQTSFMVDYLLKHKDSEHHPDLAKGCREVAKNLALANEFFRASFERLRVIDRMYVSSSGRMGRLLSNIKVEDFLSSYMGAMGGSVSVKQVINEVMHLIFHEFLSIPFPSFVKVYEKAKFVGYSIAEFLFVPDTYLLPPPRCNVIFPSQQLGFQFSEDFRAAPTRMGFRYTFPLLPNEKAETHSYSIKYYPTSFSDFMFGSKNGRKSTTTELNSELGPSKLLKGTNGQTYGELFYGSKSRAGSKANSVGPAYMPTLREADFMTNEESIKGIYYATEVATPNYTAMVRGGGAGTNKSGDPLTKSTSRDELMGEIGKYLFFKKRYASRQVSANIMFNPFIVPGFTALFIDDSEAGQSFIAKIQSVSHSFTQQGFVTNVDLAYGRDFDEIDIMTGSAGDPPLPSWFDDTLFGKVETGTSKYFNLETDYLGPAADVKGRKGGTGAITEEQVQRRRKVNDPTVYLQLSKFYNPLLGCDSITEVGPVKKDGTQKVIVTTEGACLDLIREYRNKKDQFARDAFVRSYIQRPVVTMEQAFNFLGAEVVAPQNSNIKKIPDEFAEFTGITDKKRTGLPGRFDGTGYSDEIVLKLRRDIVTKYIKQLKERRGFRG